MSGETAVRTDIFDGIKAAMPVVVSIAPFGLLFGALAVKNGFTPFEAALMSATVFAGASQMVGLELFGQKVAPWLIVLSVFAVNFRHILYSASIGRLIRHWNLPQKALGFFLLVDPQFAEAEARHERGKPVSFAWYMGMAGALYVPWVAEAWIGARFGNLVQNPERYGVDFILPVYFLILVMGFRRRKSFFPVVLASGAGSVIAEHFVGSPWHVSLGALAGIAVAAAMPVDAGQGAKAGAGR